jgi:glutathionyl-hydroquinone reductase
VNQLAAAAGRYVLYGGLTCPFTHRALLARVVAGIDALVPVVLAHSTPGVPGWRFDLDGVAVDPFMGLPALADIYRHADPGYAGPYSVPLLWDLETHTVTSNNSREIVLLLNTHEARTGPDLYPSPARARIDADIHGFDSQFVRQIIRAGSTPDQREYDDAVAQVFQWLDGLDGRLMRQRFLGGDMPDFADLVMFTGLIRFDTCYHPGSRCHLRRITDYEALWGYVRDIYQWPGVPGTVDLDAYRRSYFSSGPAARDGVIPIGPALDLDAPAGRAAMFA